MFVKKVYLVTLSKVRDTNHIIKNESKNSCILSLGVLQENVAQRYWDYIVFISLCPSGLHLLPSPLKKMRSWSLWMMDIVHSETYKIASYFVWYCLTFASIRIFIEFRWLCTVKWVMSIWLSMLYRNSLIKFLF